MDELKSVLIERIILILSNPICLILIIGIISLEIFMKVHDYKENKNKQKDKENEAI